jgi:hypothetical protein
MPGYKGHLVGGCVVYVVLISVVYTQCPSYLVAGRWLICALAGSLFPDIDVKSKGQNYFYWLVLFMALILIARKQLHALACLSLVSMTPMLVRHRGIFHRWWFIVAVGGALWMLALHYAPAYGKQVWGDALFFILGALSHVWLDVGWRRMFRW